MIYDQLLSSRMQSDITSSVSVTPAEVNLFFESIKQEGDLPLVPLKFELSQVVKVPEIGSEEKSRVRKKLISFRDRVNKGEDFKVLATLYSEDVESGMYGFPYPRSAQKVWRRNANHSHIWGSVG